MEQWDEIQRTRSDFEDSNSFPTGEEDPCQAKTCCWDFGNNCTHIYFFPSTLAAWLLEVGEGDVSVPPIIDRVVEDIVKGGKVCRGGEGGAAVVVAWCLSPNSRPHLRLKWLTSRDIGTTEVIWSASTTWLTTDNLFEPNKHLPFYWQSRHIYHSQLSGPSLVTWLALPGLLTGNQVHVNLFTSPNATTTALAEGHLIIIVIG